MANLKYIGKNILNHTLEIKKGNVSGSAASTGSFGHLVLGDRDTDASFEFGRAHIGHIGFSDMIGFSHIDKADSNNFALAQSNSGKTIIQASSGQPIAFKIGGTDRVQINSSGDLGIGIETATEKLHVVGNAFATGNISGSITSTGSFGHLKLGNVDTDASFEFGRVHIGHIGFSDMAGFSHVDNDSTSNFALAQSAAGKTIVNAKSGQPIAFKINNTDRVQISSAGNLGVGIETAAHKLHIVGDGFFTGDISGSVASTGSFGHMESAGNVLPKVDNAVDLGSTSRRWANLFVGDLVLSNIGSGGNDIDGTEGNWIIQEGEESLYLLNRKNNKKYKFKLEEVD